MLDTIQSLKQQIESQKELIDTLLNKKQKTDANEDDPIEVNESSEDSMPEELKSSKNFLDNQMKFCRNPREAKTSKFNIEEEVKILFGTKEQMKAFQSKAPKKDLKLDIPTFSSSIHFEDWWREFAWAISENGLIGHIEQIYLSFNIYMSKEIREHLK